MCPQFVQVCELKTHMDISQGQVWNHSIGEFTRCGTPESVTSSRSCCQPSQHCLLRYGQHPSLANSWHLSLRLGSLPNNLLASLHSVTSWSQTRGWLGPLGSTCTQVSTWIHVRCSWKISSGNLIWVARNLLFLLILERICCRWIIWTGIQPKLLNDIWLTSQAGRKSCSSIPGCRHETPAGLRKLSAFEPCSQHVKA